MKETNASGFTQPAIGSGPAPTRIGLLAARDFLEVRFGGTGEQGVILMGVVLAMAATRDHRYVAQTQTYGLEERGGHGHSDVIISDNPVDYPELQAADLVVAFCQDAADGYVSLLRRDGVFIFDSENVFEPPQFEGTSFGIPFTRLAIEATGQKDMTPDVFALGAVVGITGVVSEESLQKAVTGVVTTSLRNASKKALARGLALESRDWRREAACS
jgi:2-oxoglutarate ferredoxin oxidoreductase subunit gamma